MAEVAAAAEKERQRPALASAASAASAVGCGASKPPLYYRENSLDRDRLFALHLRPQRPLTRANAVAVPKTPDQAWTSYPAWKKKHKKLFQLKFMYSEKATKFCEISTNHLTGST
jgi:hypothetical protein